MKDPKEDHMEAARGVLRNLKGNPGQGILLRRDSNLQVYAYCDSDWGACPLTRSSLIKFLMTLGGSPIA